jgi:hypothetical protein
MDIKKIKENIPSFRRAPGFEICQSFRGGSKAREGNRRRDEVWREPNLQAG